MNSYTIECLHEDTDSLRDLFLSWNVKNLTIISSTMFYAYLEDWQAQKCEELFKVMKIGSV